MTIPIEDSEPLYRPGRPLHGLSAAELFVVASVRLWVVDVSKTRADPSDWPDWRRGMTVAGLDGEAIAAFDIAMRVIGLTAREPLPVCPPACPRLGRGEAMVLSALALAQDDDRGGLEWQLAGMLCPTGVRIARWPLAQLSGALAEVGLTLPARRIDAGCASERLPADATIH